MVPVRAADPGLRFRTTVRIVSGMEKGDATRERVVDRAMRLASRDGLEGLSIGTLATELGLSKSGLFGHFGSKEGLQLEVLKTAAERFQALVVAPAFKAPRGEPRLKAFLNLWLGWGSDPAMPGGCIFHTASVEYDDRPGPLRDYLVSTQKSLQELLAKTVRLCVEAGHFRAATDSEQLAYELSALLHGYYFHRRLLEDPKAEQRVRTAFDRLVAQARR